MHSFCGIGAGDAGLQRCIDLGSRPASAQAWRKCKRLIIDEISMVDGEYFEVSNDKVHAPMPPFSRNYFVQRPTPGIKTNRKF